MSLLQRAHDTTQSRHVSTTTSFNRYTSLRPVVLGVAKLAFLPLVSAAPTFFNQPIAARAEHKHGSGGMEAGDPDLWLYLGVAIVLVLSGGAFAGLTIALMGQDETYLRVIATSGEGAEKRHARKVLDLLGKGKHWVLVTLLLSNVITNETLPIVLDRSLGGGWPAVVSSTVLIGKESMTLAYFWLTVCSHLRRDRPTIDMRALRTVYWCFHGTIRALANVGALHCCMAYCKIARLSAWRGPWHNIQQTWSQDSCAASQDTGPCASRPVDGG